MSAASDEILREFTKRQLVGMTLGGGDVVYMEHFGDEYLKLSGLPSSDTFTLTATTGIVDALKNDTMIMVDGWAYPKHEATRASIHAALDLWLDAQVAQ